MNVLTAESRPPNTVRAAKREPMQLYFLLRLLTRDHIVLSGLSALRNVRMNHESIKTAEYLASIPPAPCPR